MTLSTDTPVVRLRAVAKRYGATIALDGLDLEVARGEIVGLVGPNGAGKSSAFKAMLGLLRLDAGAIEVLGLDVRADSLAVKRRVAYLPGDLAFYASWTGRRFLEFMLAWHPSADLDRAEALARELEVPLERRIKTLSSGMRQKLGIVQALASNAELLLLDEPTRGLDPTSQARFLELLEAARGNGATILLSSHALGEIERVADRCEFIDRGKRVAPDVIARLRESFRRRLRVRPGPLSIGELESLSGIARVESDGADVVLELAGDPAACAAELLRRGVESLEYNRPSLEDLYRRLYLVESERAS